ncbi:single-stranded DNA-binding protein [Candidatus Saccharibacteria bacterium]|nr:MAG: single-stranded DNA-binding protein [Candidatus Saccharibacteria bacterium]
MDKEASIAYAKKNLEDIISFFGLNTDITATLSDDVIELSIPSSHLNGFLIGQRGDTLKSLQLLVSMALRNQQAELTRVNIDVADYKRQRAERLAEQVRGWAEEVTQSGEAKALRPMSAVDRRVVHHTIGEFANLSTSSEGEGRDRHVVISPTAKESPTNE